ncbi:hypothetical protein scyTo_0001238 [Scyliorhinus torazame]|uniref:Uncharacterized protein n=1 Tax=Scyliorhinus torazame TaxID=75743 RepID=A0A401PAX5_SCYTO|nr:hypothetical protein [Scyliorhinus torazame]
MAIVSCFLQLVGTERVLNTIRKVLEKSKQLQEEQEEEIRKLKKEQEEEIRKLKEKKEEDIKKLGEEKEENKEAKR